MVKRCIFESKNKANEQKRKMNQNVNENRKLLWKEVGKVNVR